jgi:hypothetical protein
MEHLLRLLTFTGLYGGILWILVVKMAHISDVDTVSDGCVSRPPTIAYRWELLFCMCYAPAWWSTVPLSNILEGKVLLRKSLAPLLCGWFVPLVTHLPIKLHIADFSWSHRWKDTLLLCVRYCSALCWILVQWPGYLYFKRVVYRRQSCLRLNWLTESLILWV